MYKLTLTLDEIRAIRFVSSRGYAEAVLDALNADETRRTSDSQWVTTFEIPEHLAWNIANELENNGGHHFGPVSDELTAKLYTLVDSIV